MNKNKITYYIVDAIFLVLVFSLGDYITSKTNIIIGMIVSIIIYTIISIILNLIFKPNNK